MSNKIIIVAMLLCVISLSGCFRHVHTMGSGPHSNQTEEHHQWYALWGLVPLADEKDGGSLAGTTNCRITTEFKPLDCLINFFTGAVSIHRTTITIEK